MITSPQRGIEKGIRLVEYLTRIATIRAKLVRDISEYTNIFWLADVPHERGCFTQAWGRDEDHESDEWLDVLYWREPELPAIPAQCKDWVELSLLRDKNELPNLRLQIIKQHQDLSGHEEAEPAEPLQQIEYLENNPDIQRVWANYIENMWIPWVEKHNSWEKVHKVYSALFAIHQEQLRLGEEYELVLGLGLLTWQTPTGQRVRRHLIVADAILDFEARLGRFTVRPHTEGVRLRPELDMLDIEEQPAHAEETAKNLLSKAEDEPWERGCVDGVLQALVHSISPEGSYYDASEKRAASASTKPIVEYAPALILRKRSAKGLTEALKKIKDQIENGELIPGEFADLAEIGTKDDHNSNNTPDVHNITFDGEIFFPKPSNAEQRKIVNTLQTASGILVQGPPGTGKSHTIANLISHLLATGQRTLITAKTPRALKVLEGLVPHELRPLCINLLGSGLEERHSLESSVEGILSKHDEWNESFKRIERTDLENNINTLREEKSKVDRRLRDIRESETHDKSISGSIYRGTAARIAESVNQDRNIFGWFTDVITLDMNPEVDKSNLCRIILDEMRHFTPEKRKELALAFLDAVPRCEDFASLVKEERSAIAEDQRLLVGADERIADILSKSSSATVEKIHNALYDFMETYRRLSSMQYVWANDAIQDAIFGNTDIWNEIIRVTIDTIKSIEGSISTADDTTIQFPENYDINTLFGDTWKLKEHMKLGGKLGWGIFRPKIVKDHLYIVNTVFINGHLCSSTEHFETLACALRVRIACEKAWNFWVGRVEKVQGPYALQLTVFRSLRTALESILSLQGLVNKCRAAIRECPVLNEPVWTDVYQVQKITASCQLALARFRRHLIDEEIQRIDEPVSFMVARGNVHPFMSELLGAIRNRNVDAFAIAESKIIDLKNEHLRLKKVDSYLSELRSKLPNLTSSLEETYNEAHWEERLQRIDDAWHWAQARYWVEDYIRKEDSPALEKRAKQIEDELNDIIARLAAIHAWSFCFSRLEEKHRRHMEAWQQSMRRLGKGTGKHAPRHRREAQGHLNECREAVPAWVMPLHRVWDTVTPAPGIFDVIIIDEASQCGLEALPLFYLGKKIVIVGDDKQISPDAVGLDRGAVQRLMQELLYDFNFKSPFDIESSLFDHGKLRYGTKRITLREHFRCMPEIIRFSNDLCYSNTPLIPLRQYGPNRLIPLEHTFVREGYREGTNNRVINRPEADAVVAKIAELCSDSRYDDKSFGVIVLQGEAQASLIESQLLDLLGAEEIERRHLVCGNPYSFQGDERDIIFLSLVAASNANIGSLTKAADERRFNVAASRARDKMILFHSVTSDDLSTSCLRRKLLDFFEGTKPQQIAGIDRNDLERQACQGNRRVIKPPLPFDSWFEVDVALELLRKDFTVLPQYEVAGKRIDLVIEGGQARLAVECDGDQWHGPDRYEDDMLRQRQLERCGWEFFRVRESAFYANKDVALQKVWPMLKERGIFPRSEAEAAQRSHAPLADKLQSGPTTANIGTGLKTSMPPVPSLERKNVVAVELLAKPDSRLLDIHKAHRTPIVEPIHQYSNIVEIGDTVRIKYVNGEQTMREVTLSATRNEPTQGIIHIDTPLGRSLLDAEVGEEIELVTGNTIRKVRIEYLTKLEKCKIDSNHTAAPSQGTPSSVHKEPRKLLTVTTLPTHHSSGTHLDPERFYETEYISVLQPVAIEYIDRLAPITLKHLSKIIARAHGFQRTGPLIVQQTLAAISRVRQTTKTPDGAIVVWPKNMPPLEVTQFRGLAVDGEERSWQYVPHSEKLGLAIDVYKKNRASFDLPGAMADRVGLTRLKQVTREEFTSLLEEAKRLTDEVH